MSTPTVAALFVETGGVYFGLDGVDPWDEVLDARTYPGPHPVVAHPPCQRWGRYAAVGGRKLGDDDGCFASALASVKIHGGVLEHPAQSRAWERFNLRRPPAGGGWVVADALGYTCCVYQGHYGHRAPKATWLYAVKTTLPMLKWGPTPPRDLSHLDPVARKRAIKTGICQRLSRRQRATTPEPFRDLLLGLARSVVSDPLVSWRCSPGWPPGAR